MRELLSGGFLRRRFVPSSMAGRRRNSNSFLRRPCALPRARAPPRAGTVAGPSSTACTLRRGREHRAGGLQAPHRRELLSSERAGHPRLRELHPRRARCTTKTGRGTTTSTVGAAEDDLLVRLWSDGATRPGVSVTPAGLVDGRKRMERPNAWPAPPFVPDGFPIFLASASASAKRGSLLQLRCRERARGASSLTRWSASVATDVDGGGGGAEDKGDGGAGGALLLPFLLPVEEDGQSVRAIETATGDVVVAGSAAPCRRWTSTASTMTWPRDAMAKPASGRERGRPASEANESAAFTRRYPRK